MTGWLRVNPFPLGVGGRLAVRLVAVAAYCGAVAVVLCWVRPAFLDVEWGAEASAVNGLVLGLLLAFHNRTAYERWWEGRKLWGQLVNDTRNLAIKVRAYLPTEAVERGRVPQTLVGFAEALKQHLRGAARLQDIPSFEKEAAMPAHVPLYLAGRLRDTLAAWQRDGLIDGMTALMLDEHARRLLDVTGACERIRNTPLPPSFTAMLRLGIVLTILIAPWYTLTDLGPWGLPVLLGGAFFLLGVDLADTVIEEPFGTERDDLQLDRYCRTIEESVTAVFRPTADDAEPA
jgi:putative membrane protein